MKAYKSIIKIRFIMLLQYRVAAMAGIVTQLMFGYLRVMVMYAFYSSTTAPQPISFAQTVTYIWLGQSFLALVPWSGDREVQGMIRSGNVAYELCRPLDLYNQWFCRAVAMRAAPALLRAVPLFIITTLLLPSKYGMQLPHSLGGGLAWAVSMIGAVLLSAAFTSIMNIATLWTVSGEGINRLLPGIITILSGMTIPLPLFPDWMQPVLRFLPFSGLFDFPFKFYMGSMQLSELPFTLLHQTIWIMLLALLGRWLLSKATKRIVVQGG